MIYEGHIRNRMGFAMLHVALEVSTAPQQLKAVINAIMHDHNPYGTLCNPYGILYNPSRAAYRGSTA